MSARSPFAIATAPTAAAAPTPGFAAQLFVDGVARVGKTDFVAIKSRDPGQRALIFLEVGQSNSDGLKVERVSWSPEMGKSTVEVSKAGETATLEFDEQTVKNAAAPGGPPGASLPNMPGGPMNGQPPFNRFFPPGMNAGPADAQPSLIIQRRRMRALIQSGQ
jgi:hypothetical protein